MEAEIWGFAGSIIVALFTMIGVIYSAKNTKKVNEALMQNKMDNITNQIKALEVKMEKHNSVVERVYLLEKKAAEDELQIKTLASNLNEIKGEVKEVRNDLAKISSTIESLKK